MYRIVFLLISSFGFIGSQQEKVTHIDLPYYNAPTFAPVFINDNVSVKDKITHTINDFEFLNQDSILINQNIIENRIHIANFIFTSCGSICPRMTANMEIISDRLKNDKALLFLSYSVTPWIDTPSILKECKNKGITNDNWNFLTGSKSVIYKLSK